VGTASGRAVLLAGVTASSGHKANASGRGIFALTTLWAVVEVPAPARLNSADSALVDLTSRSDSVLVDLTSRSERLVEVGGGS
jgi:hypothetical protein